MQNEWKAVLWIQIRMFLSLPDPDSSLFCADGDPDPSINNQKVRKTLILTIFRLLFDFLSMKIDVNVPSKSNKQKKQPFPPRS